ncbi:guanitoxin biosynthesis heme-dependent pre-guanitoxin N-hydroxylase GntA [Alkalisalibacterium limincola]|uniref:guanitoxin biosynthesis heme-dependent pre-guanitoxin N-hydroxylase GntA n=1 Tax=Alkalisalibacterium limincola TaxID=2699169 RepID=UPI002103F9F2|nr:guanitoxin biosynthesis heme-dependent pre-guanitoxin N-hydroxylase GntA [Alkalisalibacterium limincola]
MPRAPRPRQAFLDHVDDESFPCVGAKASRARDGMEVHEFTDLGSPADDRRLWLRLRRFGTSVDSAGAEDPTLRSLAAVFAGPVPRTEHQFEQLLWAQLARLHRLDRDAGQAWAGDVSSDPADPRFSFSLGGHPFFIIGLHPSASRRARRCPYPALVFNSHRQFEQLRADGRYAKMQAATRRRDRALQGAINPNLADFGTASEARQYSGRRVEPNWRCPFRKGD